MQPYYKKGGFFDRLDRFSRWLDYMLDAYGIMWFIPGFRKIAITKFWIDDSVLDVEFAKTNMANVIEEYNREKYWWMRAK
jgi:hypothetical protein